MGFFKQVTLRTPESVELRFALAGIGNRMLAAIIDYTLLMVGLSLGIFLWSFLAEQTIDLITQLTGNTETLELWLTALFLLAFAAAYGGYFVAFEVFWQGQTPGKRFAGIRVITHEGRPPGLALASLRSLLRPVDELFCIGFFLIVWQAQEKRLGDLVAGTLVIQTQRQDPMTLKISPQGEKVAYYLSEQCNLGQCDLGQLHPDDFGRVRSYLQRRTHLSPRAKTQLSLNLATQIKTHLHLTQIPAQTTADQFLEGLYLAYQGRFPTP
jgi:uncharacterized RDD family membrane protein YckC